MNPRIRQWLCVALVPCLVVCSLPRTGWGGLIQSPLPAVAETLDARVDAAGVDAPVTPARVDAAVLKLQAAGLSAEEARKLVTSLDGAELAQLEKADLSQVGGNGLGTVLVVLLIIAVAIWIAKNI
jgi:hypothetical protein